MTRVLSGVQPTGNLHLGNYLGAIKNWVDMQKQHESLFCIVDLHAITVPQDPESLRKATRETAAAYIACGIDPVKSVIFHQSAVKEHAELAWLFSTITPMGWLNRMTQFKDKSNQSKSDIETLIRAAKLTLKNLTSSQKQLIKEFDKYKEQDIDYSSLVNLAISSSDKHTRENICKNIIEVTKIDSSVLSTIIENIENDANNASKANLGLYSYPVLMAADILLYHATHVPVGEDQKQHLELTRDIAGAFNRQYNCEYFTLPEPMILGNATRVMSLRDGTKKMSKSEESDYSRINLTDDSDTIAKKIKKATSDMEPGISYDVEKRPEVSNLVNIFAAVTGQKREQIVAQYANSGMADFKTALAEAVVAHLSPIRTKLLELSNDTAYLDGILRSGAEKAREIAAVNIEEIKKIMGFLEV